MLESSKISIFRPHNFRKLNRPLPSVPFQRYRSIISNAGPFFTNLASLSKKPHVISPNNHTLRNTKSLISGLAASSLLLLPMSRYCNSLENFSVCRDRNVFQSAVATLHTERKIPSPSRTRLRDASPLRLVGGRARSGRSTHRKYQKQSWQHGVHVWWNQPRLSPSHPSWHALNFPSSPPLHSVQTVQICAGINTFSSIQIPTTIIIHLHVHRILHCSTVG